MAVPSPPLQLEVQVPQLVMSSILLNTVAFEGTPDGVNGWLPEPEPDVVLDPELLPVPVADDPDEELEEDEVEVLEPEV